MTCKFCETRSNHYLFTCQGCKTRFIQRESCKYLRKILVEFYEPKYGEFVNWKDGKTCDCAKVCERKARVKKKVDPYEQQTNAKGKTASSRR